MRAMIVSLLLVSTCNALAADPCVKPRDKVPLSILFFVSRGTSDSWHGDLTTEGNLYLKAYTEFASGSVMGHFRVGPEKLQSLRAAMERNRFFELPVEIQPARRMIHAPMAVIEVRDGRSLCRIALIDPPELVDSPEATRFRAVWNELWAMIPIRPTWEIRGLAGAATAK